MKTYKFNQSKHFVGYGTAYPDPKDTDNWLYDKRTETLVSPSFPITPGKRAYWDGSAWSEVDIIVNEDEQKEIRKRQILQELAELDLDLIRPIAAIINNTATEFDTNKIITLEAKKVSLRTELNGLSN
jgi:hypothetical protein